MLRKSQMWFETFFLLNWTSKWWQPLETIEWYYYFSFSEKNIRVQRLEVKQQSLTLWEIYRQKLLLCSNHPRYIFNFPGQTITHLSPVQGRNIISAILTHDLTLTLMFAVGLILSYCTWCNQINSAAHMVEFGKLWEESALWPEPRKCRKNTNKLAQPVLLMRFTPIQVFYIQQLIRTEQCDVPPLRSTQDS